MRCPILQFQAIRTLEKMNFWCPWHKKESLRSLIARQMQGLSSLFHTHQGHGSHTSRPWLWFTAHQGHGLLHIKAMVYYTSRPWFTTHQGHGSLHIKAMVHYTSSALTGLMNFQVVVNHGLDVWWTLAFLHGNRAFKRLVLRLVPRLYLSLLY